jgi:hypothetical protein
MYLGTLQRLQNGGFVSLGETSSTIYSKQNSVSLNSYLYSAVISGNEHLYRLRDALGIVGATFLSTCDATGGFSMGIQAAGNITNFAFATYTKIPQLTFVPGALVVPLDESPPVIRSAIATGVERHFSSHLLKKASDTLLILGANVQTSPNDIITLATVPSSADQSWDLDALLAPEACSSEKPLVTHIAISPDSRNVVLAAAGSVQSDVYFGSTSNSTSLIHLIHGSGAQVYWQLFDLNDAEIPVAFGPMNFSILARD